MAALRQRGWLAGEQRSVPERLAWEAMETITAKQQRPILEVIGADFEELVALLTPWCQAILAGKAYSGRTFGERQGEGATHTQDSA